MAVAGELSLAPIICPLDRSRDDDKSPGRLLPMLNPTDPIVHREGWRAGEGGVKLYHQSWQSAPAQTAKASLVILHGLGSHGGLFQPLAERLVTQGYSVYALDLRGHGRSDGQRGHINRWEEYREDVHQFVNWVQSQSGHRPCYVMGNSLGAAIALDHSLIFPGAVDGLILTAPAVSTQGISPIKLQVGRFLSWVHPRFSLSTGFKQKQPPSRDPAVNDAYETDPLRHSRGTARLSTEFFQVNRHTWEHLAELELPMLILQGAADRIAPLAVAQQFFGKLVGENKRLQVYPEGYHEIWNDINREQVMDDLVAWLEAQVGWAIEPDGDAIQREFCIER